MNKKIARINELVKILNEASKAYYQDAAEIMSNFEYDALYDELVALEAETGIVLASSPTVNVGYEVLTELPKERHEKPMLSLDKTKEISRLKEFLGAFAGIPLRVTVLCEVRDLDTRPALRNAVTTGLYRSNVAAMFMPPLARLKGRNTVGSMAATTSRGIF